MYSLQNRRERYGIIYVWKIIKELVPNLSDPITCSFSDRRGRACVGRRLSWPLTILAPYILYTKGRHRSGVRRKPHPAPTLCLIA